MQISSAASTVLNAAAPGAVMTAIGGAATAGATSSFAGLLESLQQPASSDPSTQGQAAQTSGAASAASSADDAAQETLPTTAPQTAGAAGMVVGQQQTPSPAISLSAQPSPPAAPLSLNTGSPGSKGSAPGPTVANGPLQAFSIQPSSNSAATPQAAVTAAATLDAASAANDDPSVGQMDPQPQPFPASVQPKGLGAAAGTSSNGVSKQKTAKASPSDNQPGTTANTAAGVVTPVILIESPSIQQASSSQTGASSADSATRLSSSTAGASASLQSTQSESPSADLTAADAPAVAPAGGLVASAAQLSASSTASPSQQASASTSPSGHGAQTALTPSAPIPAQSQTAQAPAISSAAVPTGQATATATATATAPPPAAPQLQADPSSSSVAESQTAAALQPAANQPPSAVAQFTGRTKGGPTTVNDVKSTSGSGRSQSTGLSTADGPTARLAGSSAQGVTVAAVAKAETRPGDQDAPSSGQDLSTPADTPDAALAQTPLTTGMQTAQSTDAAPAAAAAASTTVANLSAQIAQKAAGQTTRFDVQLDPVGLGRVNVSVEIDAKGAMSAALSFEKPEAASLLRAHSADLQQSLAQAGFDLSNSALSFSTADQDGRGTPNQTAFLGAGADGSGGQSPGGQAQNAGRAFGAASLAAAQADQITTAARTLSARGLDIRI